MLGCDGLRPTGKRRETLSKIPRSRGRDEVRCFFLRCYRNPEWNVPAELRPGIVRHLLEVIEDHRRAARERVQAARALMSGSFRTGLQMMGAELRPRKHHRRAA